jgi:hypothetical protein
MSSKWNNGHLGLRQGVDSTQVTVPGPFHVIKHPLHTLVAPPPNHVPVVDCLPPDCPTFRLPPANDSDTDLSLSTASSHSLLQPPSEIPPEQATLPDHTRRPANPGRLNATWQTLFRNALNPAPSLAAPTMGTLPDLPPPLRQALNETVRHDFSKKRPGSFRIWDANINGLSAKDGYSALHDLCSTPS